MTGSTRTTTAATRRTMARHRGPRTSQPLYFVLAGVLITAVLAGSIQLAGVVTNLRAEIQTLARACDETDAQRALLAVRWNSESSRQVVIRRAHTELDLVLPDEPGLVLVATPPARRHTAGDEVLAVLLPGDPTPAAYAGEQP